MFGRDERVVTHAAKNLATADVNAARIPGEVLSGN